MTAVRIHPSAQGIPIAFRHVAGTGPAIVFLPGYMSDMDGSKATAVLDRCAAQGRECLLFDYSGCGRSGGTFADGTLSKWRDEALELIEAHVGSGAIVLVGSSMGGWLMLLVAELLRDRLAGLIGIAAAPDFTRWGYNQNQRAQLASGQTIHEENPYGPEPTPTHARFFQDAETQLRLEGEVTLNCPVRLLHGQRDADVPWETSMRLATALRSDDVQVTLIKGGDHRLSRPGDIALLLACVDALQEREPT